MRLWRGDFTRGGIEALKASVCARPRTAQGQGGAQSGRVTASKRPWRIGRTGRSPAWWKRSIQKGELSISRIAALQGAAEKRFRFRRPRHTLKGRQIADGDRSRWPEA